MIVYDSKKWKWFFTNLIVTFRYSYNLRQMASLVILATAYASIATYINLKYLSGTFSIDPIFFSLIGVILSLFLVFRLTTGYDRWWEGRKAWGKLINDSRTLALQLNSVIPSADIRRKYFSRHIYNFCTSLVWHLRDDLDSANYILEDGERESDIRSARHQPSRIASYLFNGIEGMYTSGQITEFDKMQVKDLLKGLLDVLGVCERIKKTPIPYSHSTFINMFIIIYILILPFGLAEAFAYLTIPAVTIMAFAMIGIEVISEEIENPFGMDANDLPTGQLSNTIRDNVYEILNVSLNEGDLTVPYQAKRVAEILH